LSCFDKEGGSDPGKMATLDGNHTVYVYCAGGYRSAIALTLLKKKDIHNPCNVVGGWSKITELKDKFEIEKSVEVLN